MVVRKSWSAALPGLLLGLLSSASMAAEQSVKILLPWDGEGSVYTIGAGKLLFMGEFAGIMYVETSKGELDAAYANCPASQHIDLENKQTQASGYCTITISSEEVVFAEWNCKGQVGNCEGKFTLTGGTGKYAGVTGASDMRVRSVLNTLVVGMGNGGAVRAATGLAILPNLTYTLAEAR